MQREIIGILDSGLGGISLLIKLYKNLSNKTFVYLGDRKNNPYGNKSSKELLQISFNNVTLLKSYGVKKIFIACNTLSCAQIENLKSIFPEIDFFGVFPPIELCIVNDCNPLLLCTMATARFYLDKNIDVIAFKNLASDIENATGHFEKVNLEDNLLQAIHYSNGRVTSGFNTKSDKMTTDSFKSYLKLKNLLNRRVILGCTHYFFIKNQINNHFRPTEIIDATNFTLRYYNAYNMKNKSTKTLVKSYQNDIIILGDNREIYYKIFQNYLN